MNLRNKHNFSWLAVLLIINMQSFSSTGADTPVSGILNQIDVAVKEIKSRFNGDISKTSDLKNWCDSILNRQPSISTVLIADNKGVVQFECSSHQENSSLGMNVSKNGWFSKTVSGNTIEFYDVVKKGNKRVLLNSWIPAQKLNAGAVSVAAVLIDLETVLTSVNSTITAPAALLFNGKTLYESNWIKDASTMVGSTEMKGLEIAVMTTEEQLLPNAAGKQSLSLANESYLLLGIAIVALLVGITGIILFIISQHAASKLRKESYLKLEEEKLSDQEKEKIHKLAVSHVYCEVKRQVETHELHDIESQVRHEIETSIRNKPIVIDPVKAELNKTVMNN